MALLEKNQYGQYIYDITNREDAEQINFGKWYDGWNSNTFIKNVSGQSVTKLVLESGVPGIG